MSFLESDTFLVSHKKFLVERELLRTSIIWKALPFETRTDGKGDVIKSPAFRCSGCTWDMKIAFASGSCNVDTPVLFCLRMKNFEIPIRLFCFKVTIFDAEKKLHDSISFEQSNGNLWKNLYTGNPVYVKEIPEIKNALTTNDQKQSLTIFTDIIIDARITIVAPLPNEKPFLTDGFSDVTQQNGLRSLSEDFEDLFNNPVYADVTLKLGTDFFRAHKLVLMSRSNVFRDIFEHVTEQGMRFTVCVEEMDVQSFKDLLRYIYCGQVRDLTPVEALNLYVAAHRYQLPDLVLICRERIQSGMSPSNVCRVFEEAIINNDVLLMVSVRTFLNINVNALLETDEWRDFSAKRQDLSLKLLEWAVSDSICV